MAIEGFDYQNFSQVLASQAGELLPEYFDDFQKKYVTNTISNFANLAGEALYNDATLNFDAEQAMMVTQIIAEWSFHKSVDLVKSGILSEYWDGIMQKIAFTIFEIAKNAMVQKIPTDQILQIVEQHVIKSYEEALAELKTNGIINDTLYENAAHQSNIDAMMEQIQNDKNASTNFESHNGQSDSKTLKLAAIALLLKQLSNDRAQIILNKFNYQDAQLVVQYMQMTDLEQKVDKNIALKYLSEIKINLPVPKKINPNKILSKIHKMEQDKGKVSIEIAIRKERANVQKLINYAYDGEYSKMPPRVANIIAEHLEERV